MALCPNCQLDKPFFAVKCHSCNTPTGLWEMTWFNTVWGLTTAFAWLVVFLVLGALLS